MRFHSTPESALNGEITVLAVIECLVSVAIYLGIGVYFGSFKYLATAVIAAPLMLFRTEVSSDWGLKLFMRYLDSVEVDERFHLWGGLIVGPIVAGAIRVFAPVYWTIRSPLQTLREMPQNWLRQSLCTDFFHPPEMLPLEATKGDPSKMPTFTQFLVEFRAETGMFMRIVVVIVFIPYVLGGYLPSLIYRISFKATSVAYLPFIWVAHATLRNPMPADKRLKRITKGELEKVRRKLSLIIGVTLLAKFGFVLGWVDWSRIEEKFPSKKLVQSLVVPDGWPFWQITIGADAMLTFFLLFFADAALARLNGQHAWREQTVLGTVSTVSFLRAAISLITISHFFHIALVTVAPGPLHRLLAG